MDIRLSVPVRRVGSVATAEDVRRIALALPRAYEALVRDHVKFRVGRIVFLSISPDEERLGFGFPKEERAALVASEPEKFLMPLRSDERYNWVRARLARIDEAELRELIIDAWRMCVPKRVAAAYRADAVRWALARIRERPAFEQLRERVREIEELKTQF